MTSYTLRLGYNSSWRDDAAWAKMVESVERIRVNTGAIIGEVLRLEPTLRGEEMEEYAKSYISSEDLTLRIIDDPIDGRFVRQSASGGGNSRDLKEALRRAFCRLVIEAMHRERIEVSLIVS